MCHLYNFAVKFELFAGVGEDFAAWKESLLQKLTSSSKDCCSSQAQSCECGKTDGGCCQESQDDNDEVGDTNFQKTTFIHFVIITLIIQG